MNWSSLFDYLQAHGQQSWARQLQQDSADWLLHHGDYARWEAAVADLPPISCSAHRFDQAAVTILGETRQSRQLQAALQGLMPWRKGPYHVAGIDIDSEWRSDHKWDRVLPDLAPLSGRRILDIGCGNGYHCWRMLAQNPELVLGIEPSVLFNLQFQAMQYYLQQPRIHMLPIGVQQLPDDLAWFDTVFSMGVLYHRKSPLEHLLQLKGFLVSGGELCLETLVIEGDAGQVLLPPERYARMRNVWFIPSAAELENWLRRCGFTKVRCVDETTTGLEEQRSTAWMQFESLAQCLDPNNPGMTVEGLPAPRRAVILANKP